jgi:hypothetical protein
MKHTHHYHRLRTVVLPYLVGLMITVPSTALAFGLADVGAGYVPGMWAGPCSVLPYCNLGANGVLIMTGIVINAILWAIGSAATLIILYAAIRLVVSGGNEEMVRKAWKEMIFYALLGLIFTILADTIVNYVIGLVSTIAAS